MMSRYRVTTTVTIVTADTHDTHAERVREQLAFITTGATMARCAAEPPLYEFCSETEASSLSEAIVNATADLAAAAHAVGASTGSWPTPENSGLSLVGSRSTAVWLEAVRNDHDE